LRWIEPWYLAYALQGASVAGLIPILIPLVVNQGGSVAQVGLVMAGFNFGGLAAPLWGALADRFRLHRWLLVGGLLLTTVGLFLFPFVSGSVPWLLLALLQGVGSAGAATVANLFVVEVHPEAEWDERIGWLQTFYGGGQVAGLLVAGFFSQSSVVRTGIFAAAGVTLLAGLIGWLTTHTPARPSGARPILKYPTRTGEWTVGSPQRLFHHLTAEAMSGLGSLLRSPFGLFMLVWLLTFGGTAVIFSLYPVLMQGLFGVSPVVSSPVFAVAAGLGLFLYSPAGSWSARLGTRRVMLAGFGARLVAVAVILVLGITHTVGLSWLALLGFVMIVLAWSLLSVSSTALAADLSPAGEGAGLGLFNAVTALAGVLGSFLGGAIAGASGFPAALGLALAGILAGLMIFVIARNLREKES
jgi:DHA1 family tetracycline resistance protein-like MFS transporter